ncbi:MAG: tetratricopeptide repeat protein, partial [Candidatus Odinarchaeota archaeon]
TGNKRDLATCICNIGNVYSKKGDLNRALVQYQECLAIQKSTGDKLEISRSLCRTGIIYFQKRNLKEATKLLEESLALAKETGNKFEQSEILFHLVSVKMDSGQMDQAQEYCELLQRINDQVDNRLVKQRYLIAKALILKTSSRLRNRGKAEEILTLVVSEDISDDDLTVTAMLNLVDLLLYELKMNNEKEIMNEIIALIEKLQENANKQQSYSLLAMTYVLQSKLEILKLDIEKAKEKLDKAEELLKDKELHKIAELIDNIQMKIKDYSKISPEDLLHISKLWQETEKDNMGNHLLPAMRVVQNYFTQLIKEKSSINYFEELIETLNGN